MIRLIIFLFCISASAQVPDLLLASRQQSAPSGGVPVLESYETNWQATTNSIVVDKPTGTATDDLLVIFVGNDRAATITQWDDTTNKPTGFDLQQYGGTGTSDSHLAAFTRVVDGTEGSSFTVPSAESFNTWVACLRISGVDTASPVEIVGSIAIDDATTHVAGSVTTTNPNCLILSAISTDGSDKTPYTVSGTGWSKVADVNGGNSNVDDVGGGFATKEQATADATGDCTWTVTGSGDGGVTFQIAIKGL